MNTTTATNNFVWQSKRFCSGTRVKFKEEFVEKFRWHGEKIWNIGIFEESFWNDGKKMFHFRKLCAEEMKLKVIFPCRYDISELELLDAIEEIITEIPVELYAACKPPRADEKLKDGYNKARNFFVYEGGYFGNGSKIYLKDDFMLQYEEKTGKKLTKKVMFINSTPPILTEDIGKHEYLVYCSLDMRDDEYDNYEGFVTLTEKEFYDSIEIITECFTIKHKDTEDPMMVVCWIFFICLIALSTIFFVDVSGIVLLAGYAIYKLRKMLLYM